MENTEIEQFVKSNLPEKLANGLSQDDACMLYMAKNKLAKTTDEGLVLTDSTGRIIRDKRMNPIPVAESVKAFAESFIKPKAVIEGLKNRSEAEAYFLENHTPLSEQAGILAKAMKNEGFKISQ